MGKDGQGNCRIQTDEFFGNFGIITDVVYDDGNLRVISLYAADEALSGLLGQAEWFNFGYISKAGGFISAGG